MRPDETNVTSNITSSRLLDELKKRLKGREEEGVNIGFIYFCDDESIFFISFNQFNSFIFT